MRYSSVHKKIFFTIFIFYIISLSIPYSTAQGSSTLGEISQDWSKDMILVFVETPNKFDNTYGTNITDMVVLNEISAIEKTINRYKDEITFVLSISTLIKEINVAPRNIAQAMEEELGVSNIPDIPGEYAIPQDQDEIDDIVGQIPDDTRSMFVMDTNNDDIWDSAVIMIGTVGYYPTIRSHIDDLIDDYYIDSDSKGSAHNSEQSWWNRIETGEIHCSMTNLGYVKSYEYYYGTSLDVYSLFSIVVIVVLVGSLIYLILAVKYYTAKENDKIKMKKQILSIAIIFLILIVMCIPFANFIKTSPSQSNKLTQLSDEFNGGQVGLVIVRGNPAPAETNVPTEGGGSMKDIEVLDDIDNLETQLNDIDDSRINPALCNVDIMKMIEVPESLNASIPYDQLPPSAQESMEEIFDTSFWNAIHIAGVSDSPAWQIYYGQSLQDSLIDIFYNSLTVELRNTFVNHDYSKSLIYIPIPMTDEERTEDILNRINDVNRNYPAGTSTSKVALINSYDAVSRSLDNMINSFFLLSVLVLGVAIFLIFSYDIHKGDRGGKQGPERFLPKEQYPHSRYPPYR